jgi:hypothetical protein
MRKLVITESHGIFSLSSSSAGSVSSSTLDNLIRKAATRAGVADYPDDVECRSLHDAIQILDTILGPGPKNEQIHEGILST